jgi:hypothetical protein
MAAKERLDSAIHFHRVPAPVRLFGHPDVRSSAPRKKAQERTSRRSVSQATDSTRRGWIEKKRAPTAAAPSIRAGAASGRARPQELPDQEEHQDGIQGMEQVVDGVVSRRIHAPEEVVDRERDPRDGHVVAVVVGEHPLQVLQSQPAIVQVGDVMDVVVPIEEFALQGGKESRERDDSNEGREGESQAGRAGGAGSIGRILVDSSPKDL